MVFLYVEIIVFQIKSLWRQTIALKDTLLHWQHTLYMAFHYDHRGDITTNCRSTFFVILVETYSLFLAYQMKIFHMETMLRTWVIEYMWQWNLRIVRLVTDMGTDMNRVRNKSFRIFITHRCRNNTKCFKKIII